MARSERRCPRLLVAFTAMCLPVALGDDCNLAWTYKDPAAWADLSGMCAHPMDQSPIDIHMPAGEPGEPVNYTSGPPVDAWCTLNEHTWEVDYGDSGSSVTWKGAVYDLLQFHFHSPSEHTLDGKHLDFEMHLVHVNKETQQILVVAFLFSVGEANEYLAKIWSAFPLVDGKNHIEGMLDPMGVLVPKPEAASYLTYMGSTTTPPCVNETIWVIMYQDNKMSAEQLQTYRIDINNQTCSQLAEEPLPAGVSEGWDITLGTNNRPLQEPAGRAVQWILPSAAPPAPGPTPPPSSSGGGDDAGMWTAGLILLMVLLVGFGGYFLYRSKRQAAPAEAKEQGSPGPYIAMG